MFKRAALNAGRQPPANPINKANSNPSTITPGVMVKVKAISENVCQFMVETVKACMKDASTSPMTPPMRLNSNASRRKAPRILARRNPMARKVPISAVRLATEAYMVIIAPMIAPMENMVLRIVPRMRRKFAMSSDCLA